MPYQTESLRTSEGTNSTIYNEFESLLMTAHYYATRAACNEAGTLEQLVAKLSISLLRYSDVVPADKAYYEAGVAARVSSG